MSKTYIINFMTGEKITRLNEKAKLKKTKFMGWTSGSHSHGVYDHSIEDGKLINTKTDRAPIKGKDFVKYGYPMSAQHKSELITKSVIKSLNQEIDEYLDEELKE